MLKKSLMALFLVLSCMVVYGNCCSNVNKNYHSSYSNGKIYERGDIQNGMKQGEWLVFYENGQLKHRAMYVDDKIEGNYVTFDEGGYLDEIVNYIDNRPQGISFKFYDGGRIKESRIYKKDGTIIQHNYNQNKDLDFLNN